LFSGAASVLEVCGSATECKMLETAVAPDTPVAVRNRQQNQVPQPNVVVCKRKEREGGKGPVHVVHVTKAWRQPNHRPTWV